HLDAAAGAETPEDPEPGCDAAREGPADRRLDVAADRGAHADHGTDDEARGPPAPDHDLARQDPASVQGDDVVQLVGGPTPEERDRLGLRPPAEEARWLVVPPEPGIPPAGHGLGHIAVDQERAELCLGL